METVQLVQAPDPVVQFHQAILTLGTKENFYKHNPWLPGKGEERTLPRMAVVSRVHDLPGYEQVAAFLKHQKLMLLQHTAAGYLPGDDVILMPDPDSFRTPDGYYSVLLHECVHKWRNDFWKRRKMTPEFIFRPNRAYIREEVVAEAGSFFLGTVLGLAAPVEWSASYCFMFGHALDERLVDVEGFTLSQPTLRATRRLIQVAAGLADRKLTQFHNETT